MWHTVRDAVDWSRPPAVDWSRPPSVIIFDRHANLKYTYGNRHFWCREYYVDTVGKYEGAIGEYIRNQLQNDIANDQLSVKETASLHITAGRGSWQQELFQNRREGPRELRQIHPALNITKLKLNA